MSPRLPREVMLTLRILAAFFGTAAVIWTSYLILEVCGARDTMPELFGTGTGGGTIHSPTPTENSAPFMIYSLGYFSLYVASVLIAPVLVLTGIFFAFAMSLARKKLQS